MRNLRGALPTRFRQKGTAPRRNVNSVGGNQAGKFGRRTRPTAKPRQSHLLFLQAILGRLQSPKSVFDHGHPAVPCLFVQKIGCFTRRQQTWPPLVLEESRRPGATQDKEKPSEDAGLRQKEMARVAPLSKIAGAILARFVVDSEDPWADARIRYCYDPASHRAFKRACHRAHQPGFAPIQPASLPPSRAIWRDILLLTASMGVGASKTEFFALDDLPGNHMSIVTCVSGYVRIALTGSLTSRRKVLSHTPLELSQSSCQRLVLVWILSGCG